MKAFSTLKKFILEHKWNYILGILWLIIIDYVQLIVPQILGRATDLLQLGLLGSKGLIRYGLYIMLTGLIIGVGRYIWRIYILGTSRELEYYLRKKTIWPSINPIRQLF